MSQQANTKLIGLFVIGAMVAAFITLIIIQGGGWFRHKNLYVLYFESAVDGLQVGAPVLFKGVRVGSVTDIKVVVGDHSEKTILTPVYIEIEPHRIAGGNKHNIDKIMAGLVQNGLRARLEMQSFLTGLLQITFEFYPNSPIIHHAPPGVENELPTVGSALDQITNLARTTFAKLASLPLEDIVRDFHKSIKSFQKILDSPELQNSIKSLDATLIEMHKVSEKLDASLQPMLISVKTAADSTKQTANTANTTLVDLQSMLAADAPPRVNFEKSLQEISKAAHAMRLLADDLEQNPSVILRGKSNSKELP